ncbi:glycoside hydrolase family 3 N-terminal domain-containing protein [Demequina sp.]|uniref:glycoside hydrolase family 3 N-terminal domain-containing protein n=1 Tax=Demequina sp. TaxID=2050685 RepID=UPI003D0B064C
MRPLTKVFIAAAWIVGLAVCVGIVVTGQLNSEPPAAATPSASVTTPSGRPIPSPSPSPTPTASDWDVALAAARALPEDEAIGRVIMAAVSAPDPDAAAALVEKYKLGGVILMPGSLETADGVVALTSAVQQAGAGQGVPVLVGVDEEGGEVSRLRRILPAMPAFMAAGAVDDAELTADAWRSRAVALRELGITVDFAPVADVTIGPADPTIRTRSASSDPQRASRAVLAASSGLEAGGVMPVVKHFPGHGSVKQDSHLGVARVARSLGGLEKRDLVPFADAAAAGVAGMMMGHLVVKGWGKKPATVNPRAYEYARSTLGFEGVIFTDALNMDGVLDVYPAGVVEAKALAAGADVVLFPASVPKAVAGIRAALDSGELSRERLDEAVARVSLLASATEATTASGSVGLGVVEYSAAAAVVAAKDCSALVKGSVGVSGGTKAQRKRLVKALRAEGVEVVPYAKADTTVALVPFDRGTAKADVVVALNGPWGLQKSSARTYVAIWGRGAAQMDALAAVLAQPATAKGTWPVKVDVPFEECA